MNSTSPTEVAGRLADRLDEENLAYAIGGALALGVWGVPRMTSNVEKTMNSIIRIVPVRPVSSSRLSGPLW